VLIRAATSAELFNQRSLSVKLTEQEEQVIAAKPTENVEAYDAYLRGLAYNLKAGKWPVIMPPPRKASDRRATNSNERAIASTFLTPRATVAGVC
jgi:hypothetical protein